ncbi:MAG TPA: hypothetical protein VFR67_29675 [Pilimelia sp.]|nr:hypothetical protein [Pilimelia sp.]
MLLSLIVVFAVLLWPGPTAEERDAATFGVPVDRHVTRVTARFLDHSPSLADAAVPGGTAVPVERYVLDGQLLTFVVLHNATCRLAMVLLASAGDVLDVVVVYTPSEATATKPPAGGASDACRVDPSDVFAWRSALDVALPAGVRVSRVRDVGAGGPALRREP